MIKKQTILERLSEKEINLLKGGLEHLYEDPDVINTMATNLGVTGDRIKYDMGKVFNKLSRIQEHEGHAYIMSEEVQNEY